VTQLYNRKTRSVGEIETPKDLTARTTRIHPIPERKNDTKDPENDKISLSIA